MNTKEITQNYRLSKWTEIIRECRSSGQTVLAWCSEHQVNTKSYYYWLRKVRIAACESLPALGSEKSAIVPVNITALAKDKKHAETNQAPGITLRHGNITLEFHNDASAELIENTLRALQNVR